jgi:hypothetical protein
LAGQAEPSPEREIVIERLTALREFYQLLDSLVETALAMSPDRFKAMVEMVKLLVPGDGLKTPGY